MVRDGICAWTPIDEKRRFMTIVSGALASRELKQVIRGPGRAREFTFPRASTYTFDSTFNDAKRLRRAVFGKSFDTLGPRSFQNSGLRVLRIPRHVQEI